jgi:transcriptional regulator with XRE-family HTH domain
MTSSSNVSPLSKRDLGDYAFARARDQAFDAVYALWRRRQSAGLKQADLAAILGRDEGWVSRSLNGPANWTLRTLGELVGGLNGELEINVFAAEDHPVSLRTNYDAYAEIEVFSTTATANAEFKQTWSKGFSQPNTSYTGDTDLGNVLTEIKKR